MAKLVVATVVLVALFLAVAEVSCFRTIVTTTIEEVEQRGRGESQEQRCRQQVQQRYGRLRSCRSYMEPSGSPFELDMYVNQQRQQGQQEEQQQCCQALRELGDCSCHAIQQIVEEQVRRFQQGQGEQGQWGEQGQGRQGQQQQQQVQHILQKARQLPRECNLRQQCQIETPSYYYY